MNVRSLHTTFNLPLRPHEVPRWRGAFIEMAGRQYDHFHNHLTSDKYYYRYPLVHYRTAGRQAAILVFNQAIEGFQDILSSADWQLRWNGREHPLTITDLKLEEHRLKMSDKMMPYHIRHWLALKQDNYALWQKCNNMTERSELLERILVGHLLGFSSQMGWQLPERLEVNLQLIHRIRQVPYRGVQVLVFDVSFEANVDLPARIGLGKGLTQGFGLLKYGQGKIDQLFKRHKNS